MASVKIVIPARGGSKRVPRKNIAPIVGRTLLDLTIKAALEATVADNVFVSTEDKAIMIAALEAGVRLFSRDMSLADDETSATDVIRHHLSIFPRDTVAVMLQPTTPVRDPQHIRDAISAVQAGALAVIGVTRPPKLAALVAVHRGCMGFDPTWLSLARAADDDLYQINGSLFAAKLSTLDAHGGFLIPGAKFIEMDTIHSLEIDYPTDIELAKAAIAWKNQ